MKKQFITALLLLVCSVKSFADEGMWLPQLLQTLNEKEMKKMGMKIKASDIYNINKSSLKDAIVSLGGFCTAEVISNEGLILTNHHCGFDAIQNHSSIEHNYIQNGFWAYNKNEELQNPGLFVSFIVSIEDVSSSILKNINSKLSEKERQTTIDQNIATLKSSYKKNSYQDVIIRPFFDGNAYYLFVTETYKDVRLVGAPPASIGNFGKDTDNWMWPRHTGDFSMFRIYADKDNHPAAYSPNNIPYTPKRALNISLKGMKAGDFTMVFGFPGKTNEYLSAYAIQQIKDIYDPAKINIRHDILELMKRFMVKDEAIKIKYAAKYASIENAYKKWQGEVLGLQKSNAIQKKKDRETIFLQRVNANPAWKESYGQLLPQLEAAYELNKAYALQRDYYNEIIPRIELFNIAATTANIIAENEKKDAAANIDRNKKNLDRLEDIFKEYDPELDRQLFIKLMSRYVNDQNAAAVSPMLSNALINHSIEDLANEMYTASVLTVYDNIKNMMTMSANEFKTRITSDTLFQLYVDISKTYSQQVAPFYNKNQNEINQLQRSYVKAQMEVFKEQKFYPDANSTLRLTYGNVMGYQPRDGMKYDYYTYMDGIMEKYKPGDYEFDVPQKLIDLYQAKDFGPYGVNGKQPVCFIAANHTTGGNSGSPALDAYGNLVGLNFDRVWEGTMSDINYDATICRNIMVDIRYVLFIIDKFAGAKNLIAEMKIIK